MSKRKVQHEEHADETWLLPYSDLLTLLLALFIVMFVMSKVDNEKFASVSKQFNVIFSGSNQIFDKDGNSLVPLPSNVAEMINTVVNNTATEQDRMTEIKKSIEEEIKSNGYSDKVKVEINDEGLEISIQDVILFNSGDAEILQNVAPLLQEVAKALSGLDNKINIVGHTDNVPIHTEKFNSNWDLSVTRAINVMSFLVDQGGLRPERFSVQGYGEYEPKYDNSTEIGREKNRRVEVFLIRKFPKKVKTESESN